MVVAKEVYPTRYFCKDIHNKDIENLKTKRRTPFVVFYPPPPFLSCLICKYCKVSSAMHLAYSYSKAILKS